MTVESHIEVVVGIRGEEEVLAALAALEAAQAETADRLGKHKKQSIDLEVNEKKLKADLEKAKTALKGFEADRRKLSDSSTAAERKSINASIRYREQKIKGLVDEIAKTKTLRATSEGAAKQAKADSDAITKALAEQRKELGRVQKIKKEIADEEGSQYDHEYAQAKRQQALKSLQDKADVFRLQREARSEKRNSDQRIANYHNEEVALERRRRFEALKPHEQIAVVKTDEAEARKVNQLLIDRSKIEADNHAKAIRYAKDEADAHRLDYERDWAHAKRMDVMVNARLRHQERGNVLSDRAAQLHRDEQASVIGLQQEFLKLTAQKEKLLRRSISHEGTKSTEAKIKVGLDFVSLHAELARVEEEIRRLTGRDPIKFKISSGQAVGEALSRTFKRGIVTTLRDNYNREGNALGRFIGHQAGDGFRSAFRSSLKKGGNIGIDLAGALRSTVSGKIQSFAQTIGSTAIRLGPVTLAIRVLLGVFTVLGPVITSVAGSLGALIGFLGAAAAGAGALGAAVIGGAVPALAGMAAVIKPVVAQFKTYVQAQKAYNKAVGDYGKNSPQAAKKLAVLNSELAHQSKGTREAVRSFATLNDRWKALTAPARAQVFKTIGAGIAFASTHLKTFAHNTNDTSKVLGTGLRGVLKNLDFKGLSTMQQNFNAFLGPVIKGVGTLLNYFIKVGAVASKSLAPLGHTFSKWATDLLGTTNNTAAFEARIQHVISAVKSLGRFTLASGRFLKAFFGSGSRDGQKFVDTMTAALDRWTALINANPKKFSDFFKNSIENTHAFGKALAPIAKGIASWAIHMTPFITGVLEATRAFETFLGGIAKAVGALTGLDATAKSVLQTFGVLFGVGKIGKFVFGLTEIVAGLVGVRKATEAVAIAQAAGGLGAPVPVRVRKTNILRSSTTAAEGTAVRMGTVAGEGALIGAAAGAEMKAARVEVGLLRAAATKAASAIATMGAVEGAVATGGMALIASAAVYGTYKLLTMKSASDKLAESMKKDAQGTKDLIGATATWSSANIVAATATQEHHRAIVNVSKLKRQLIHLERMGKKGTAEYRDTLASLTDAINQRTAADQTARDASAQKTAAYNAEARAAEKAANAGPDLAEARKRLADLRDQYGVKPGDPGYTGIEAIAKQLRVVAAAEKLAADATRARNAAMNVQLAAEAQRQRALKGLPPLLGAAEQAMGRLAKNRPNLAVKISTRYADPTDAGRVAQSAAKALSKGVSAPSILKIVADSADAEQAIQRLRLARLDPKLLKIIESGGAAAKKVIEQIIGKKISNKTFKAMMNGQGGVFAALAKIIGIKISPKKVDAILRDLASAGLDAIERKQLSNKFVDIYARTHGNFNPQGGGAARPGGGASGTGPGFGDGSPHPAIANAAFASAQRRPVETTRGGTYNRPTLLVGEEYRTEHVISSNPAYAARNRKILKSAAWSLGMRVTDPTAGIEMAAKGKQPFKPSAKRGAADVKQAAQRQHFKVPPKLTDYIGPIDISDIKGVRDKALTSYKTARNKRQTTLNAAANANKKKPGSGKKILEKKGVVKQSEVDKKKHHFEDVDKAYTIALKAHTEFTNLESKIDIYQNAWERAAANGGKAGVPGLGVRKIEGKGGIKALWTAATKARTRRLSATLAHFPKSQRNSQMALEIRKALGESLSVQQSDRPEVTPAKTEDVSAFIERLGKTKELNADLLADSIANASPDKKDDAAPKAKLHDFYQSLIDTATAEGADQKNPTLLASLYDSLGSYNPDESSSSVSADAQAKIDQGSAAKIAYLQSGLIDQIVGNASSSRLAGGYVGPGSAIGSSGAGGAAQSQSSPSGTNVIFQSYVPPSPQQATQLAGYVASGFGSQSGSSNKTAVGI